MSGAIFKMVLSLCFLLLLSACGTGPGAEGPEQTRTNEQATTTPSGSTTDAPPPKLTIVITPSGEEVFFPRQRHLGDVAFPSAAAHGKLILDDNGCIRMKPLPQDPGFVPIWPSNYELDADGPKIRVLDDKGRLVAQVGKRVDMGGGEVGLQIPFVDERTRRELRERCPGGGYWLVFPGGVNIPRRR